MASEGSGTFPNAILGKPIVTAANTACTETYLLIDTFDTIQEAQYLAQYIKTKFFRFLVSLMKTTQNNSKDRFCFVPILPLTQTYTDKILYSMFDINTEEQTFIESIVKEMV